jgi:hypothetical protein
MSDARRGTGGQAPSGSGRAGRDGSREEVIAKYRVRLLRQPDLMAALPQLRGKDLVCWCDPDACHADVLLDVANARP